MQVIRYFHIRDVHQVRGGVCVKVTGNTDDPAQVDVQYAICSKKDAYTKAIGRSEANKAPIKVVMLRYLPEELGRMAKKADYWAQGAVHWLFAIKYFLPKE